MNGKHVNVNITSYNSLSSFLSEQCLRHCNIFKKETLQMDDLLKWQDDTKRCYFNKNCLCDVARNVSSIELEKLLHPDNSATCCKKKYKYEDFDYDLQPSPQILKYSKIVMQTCQNKGCMCKPIVQGMPKCQISDEVQTTSDNEETRPITKKNAKNQTVKRSKDEIVQSETKEPKKDPEPPSPIPSKISEEAVDVSEKQLPEKKSSEKAKKPETKKISTKYEMCKKNPCDPCPDFKRYCVPSNFEQLLPEYEKKGTEFLVCKNRDLCTCETYDTSQGLEKGLKLPGKYICVQNPKIEEEPIKESPIKKEKEIKTAKRSSSTTGCCSCFKKKKKSSEKSIQTCKCCSNKTCQMDESLTCFDADRGPCPPSEPPCERVKNIWVCSKCGKIYNMSNTCRERTSCSRNTIILPQSPGSVICTDQVDALRTMIKLEAKQNFRQIDNILQELQQQKSELKKLNDMYHGIIGTKSKNSMLNREDIDDSGLRTTQIYICEGCEVDLNRNIFKTLTKDGGNQNFDGDEKEWEICYQPDNNKYIKNIINKEKCTPMCPRKDIQSEDIENEDTIIHNAPARQNNLSPKGKRQKINNGIKSQMRYDDNMHTKVQPDKLDHLMKDEIETEKSQAEPFPKIDSDVRPNECSFVNWWKKSLTNLRQSPSKDMLKRKCRYLQRKISPYKKSLTDVDEDGSEEKLKCKIIDCKDSLTKLRQRHNMTAEKCKCNENRKKGSFLNFFNMKKNK